MRTKNTIGQAFPQKTAQPTENTIANKANCNNDYTIDLNANEHDGADRPGGVA